MSKILVIGNAESIYEHACGYIVDSYDVVIRVNRFQIKGCEAFVGRKITHWVIFPCHTFLNHLRDHLTDGHIPIEPHKVKIWWKYENQKYAQNMVNQILDKLRTPDYMINKIPHNIVEELNKELGLDRVDGKGPSTGLSAIFWSIKKWGKVDVLGFGIDQKFSSNYYNKWKSLDDNYSAHDMEKERELLTEWEKSGKIRRLENALKSPDFQL